MNIDEAVDQLSVVVKHAHCGCEESMEICRDFIRRASAIADEDCILAMCDLVLDYAASQGD